MEKELKLIKAIREADRDIDTDGKQWEDYNRGILCGLLQAYKIVYGKDLDYCNLIDKLKTYTPMNDTDIKFDTETKTTLEKEQEMSMIKAFKEMKL